MNVEPGGAAVPHVADESTAGRQTWLRLHNCNHHPMNPRCQAFSAPRDTPMDLIIAYDDKQVRRRLNRLLQANATVARAAPRRAIGRGGVRPPPSGV